MSKALQLPKLSKELSLKGSGESSISIFKIFLLVLTKFLFWQGDWTLGYHSMRFFVFFLCGHSARHFWKPMRQLIYSMFISNNCASFHLWWKENLLKYQKVSKYYDSGCSLENLKKISFQENTKFVAIVGGLEYQ